MISRFSLGLSRHLKTGLQHGRSHLYGNSPVFLTAEGGASISGPGGTGTFNINATPPYFPARSIILELLFSGSTPPAVSDDAGNVYNLFSSFTDSFATINYYVAQQPVLPATQITLTGTSGLFCSAFSQAFGFENISILDLQNSSIPIVDGANVLSTASATPPSTKKNILYLGFMGNFDPTVNCSSIDPIAPFSLLDRQIGAGVAVMVGENFSTKNVGAASMQANANFASSGAVKTMLASMVACG